MELTINCSLCEREGFTVRLPLLTYETEEGAFLGYHCHVCGYKIAAIDKPHASVDEADEELHRVIWEAHRETAEYDQLGKEGHHGKA